MIASLRGKIVVRGTNRVIVDVQGVGYDVAVSLSTLEALPADGDSFLHIHTALRENSLELYGFAESDEKVMFEALLAVSGIGPKTALSILSGIAPSGFRKAVLEGDLHRLTSIPGVGRKSAERIVLELKEKMRKLALKGTPQEPAAAAENLENDLVSSLVNLGYKERVAAEAARKVLKEVDGNVALAQTVRMALKELMK